MFISHCQVPVATQRGGTLLVLLINYFEVFYGFTRFWSRLNIRGLPTRPQVTLVRRVAKLSLSPDAPPPSPVRLQLCSHFHVGAAAGPPSRLSPSWPLASSTPRPSDRPTSVPLAPGRAGAKHRPWAPARRQAPTSSAAPEHPPGAEHQPQAPLSLCFIRARALIPWTSRRWTFPAFITIRSALHPTPPHSFLVEPYFGFRRSPGVCCIA
jgi:hypothetical protein